MFKTLSTILAVTVISAGSAQAASLLSNGSFEENPGVAGSNFGSDFGNLQTGPGSSWDLWDSLNGWTKSSGAGIEIQSNRTLSSIDAQEGLHYVELDSNNNSSMFQDVVLAAGDYVLSFFYSPRKSNAGTNGIDVSLAGYSESITGPGGALGSTVGSWTEIVRTVNIATAGTYSLAFGATQTSDSLGGLLDNVSLNSAAPVPLPAPALLLGAALGGLGMTRKLRKKA